MPKEYTDQEIKDMIEEATKELKNKNTELLGKLKKLKQFEGIDIKSLQEAADKLKELEDKNLEEEGKWKEAYDKLKADNQKTIDELNAAKEKIQTDFNNSKLKNSVIIGLMGLDVIPELSEVATASLISQASLNDAGETVFGDKDVATFMKEWAESPVGKHFIKSGNSGGGGDGSQGDALKTTYEPFFKPGTVNSTKQLELKNKDPKLYETLSKQYAAPMPFQSNGRV